VLVAILAIFLSRGAALPDSVKPIVAPGIQNMFALGTNIFSGSAPETDAAFEALAKLGIKTIITVDGTKPDVAMAHKHGLTYVHLPHGYDGISAETQAKLVKASETAPGPIFVHCHHGMHRGPAAVAVICMAEMNWSPEEGEAWLRTAGTATNYAGLYETVRAFRKPSAQQLAALPSKFPEIAETPGLTETMVQVDDRWDRLKAARKAGYKNAADDAAILWEHFREAQRLPDAIDRGSKFMTELADAEAQVKSAEIMLREFASAPGPEKKGQLNRCFDSIANRCAACHKKYRDPAGIKSRRSPKEEILVRRAVVE
jgi:protein tyrosine phosphatase (PTP) superfamily phosphohydrolase (DUF442 family)